MNHKIQICKPHLRTYKIKVRNTIFDEISFVNVVMFYKEELKELMLTRYAKNIFNIAEQHHLKNKMVYITCHYMDTGKSLGTASIPSCLTRMILSGFIKIDREELIKELDNTIIRDNGYIHTCKSERAFCFNCYLTNSLCELYYRKGGTIR